MTEPGPHAGGVDGAEPAVLRGPDRRAFRRNSTWPVFDENTASSLCYTSGTTGNPKGALYSHRSTVLHTYATALPDSLDCSARDTILPVVPMFHVNAWGLPYVGVHGRRQARVPRPMAGRQVAARAVRNRRRDHVGRRADRLAGPADARRSQRPEVQHHEAHRHRRLGLPAGHDGCLRGQVRRPGDPRLGHDRAEPDGRGGQAQGQACEPGRGATPGAAGQAGPVAVRHRHEDRRRERRANCPATARLRAS